MPDITPIVPINKIEKTNALNSRKNSPRTSADFLKGSPNSSLGSKAPFDVEMINQVNEELDNLSANAPFSPQNLQNLQMDMANLSQRSPEELRSWQKTIKEELKKLEILLNGLKKEEKLDPKIAELLLSSIHQFASKDIDTLSKEEFQNLSTSLDVLCQRSKELVAEKKLDPNIVNVLVIFLAFAKAQMDQNDKAMLSGIAQAKVKTAQLDLQSQKQKDIANKSTSGKHVSTTNCVLIGLGILVLGAIFGIFTGGLAFGAAVGAAAALVGAGAVYGYAKNNPNDPGVVGVVDEGPDDDKMKTMQFLLSYINTKISSLSSSLGFTEKMFVENVSERSMQLGQQSGQAIKELGDVMKSR